MPPAFFETAPRLFLEVCLPIMAVIAAGWSLDRCFRIDLRSLVKLNIYLFVPAFILVRLLASPVALKDGVGLVLLTLGVIAAMGLLSWFAALSAGLDPRSRRSIQIAAMFYNCGNYGIPLMALAFPPDGPVYQAFVLVTMNLTTFTVGTFLASSNASEGPVAWKRVLGSVARLPSLYAIVIAFTLKTLDWDEAIQSVPGLWKPLTTLADVMVGFALVTLGAQLSQTRPPRIGRGLGLALAIRLLGGPLVAAGLVWLFPVPWEMGRVLILGAAAPTAVNTSLLVHELGGDHAFAAAAVFYATLFSAFSVTMILLTLQFVTL